MLKEKQDIATLLGDRKTSLKLLKDCRDQRIYNKEIHSYRVNRSEVNLTVVDE